MIFHRTGRAAGITAVVVAGLLASGCGLLPTPSSSLPPVPTATEQPTPSAGDGGQAAQCAQLMVEVTSIGTDLARVGELLAGDPIQAAMLLTGITGRIGDLQTRVTDPALLERIGEIQAGWDALVEDARGSITTGDTAGIDRTITAMTALGDQVVALQEFCAGTA